MGYWEHAFKPSILGAVIKKGNFPILMYNNHIDSKKIFIPVTSETHAAFLSPSKSQNKLPFSTALIDIGFNEQLFFPHSVNGATPSVKLKREFTIQHLVECRLHSGPAPFSVCPGQNLRTARRYSGPTSGILSGPKKIPRGCSNTLAGSHLPSPVVSKNEQLSCEELFCGLGTVCTSFSYMKPSPAVWPTLRPGLLKENMGVCLRKRGRKKYLTVFLEILLSLLRLLFRISTISKPFFLIADNRRELENIRMSRVKD